MAVPVAVAGSDVSINEEDLPQVVPFDGSGSLADPGRTITGYLWEVLYQSPESSATLLNAETATPSLDSADVWQNTRVYLRVKDSAHYWSCWAPISGMAQAVPAPGTAWDDPPSGWRLTSQLEAPDSAFAHVRVLSYEMGLQKLAEGERNYTAIVDEWANALDLLEAWQATHVIADHQDTDATGAELDVLTQGGDATDMHSHSGADVARATAAARGGVLLAEAPVDPLNPKAVTRDRFTLCGSADGTDTSTGYVAGKIEVMAPVAAAAGKCHMHWFVTEDLKTVGLSGGLRDCGTIAGGGYVLGLYRMTLAQWIANDFGAATLIISTPIGPPVVDNQPIAFSVTWAASDPLAPVLAGEVIGLRVISGPSGANRGGGLHAAVSCLKAW